MSSKLIDNVNDLVDSLNTTSEALYPALAKAVIESINAKESNSIIQAIGIISGRGLLADKLLFAVANEIKSMN